MKYGTDTKKQTRSWAKRVVRTTMNGIMVAVLGLSLGAPATTQAAGSISQVSTGYETACAVVDGWVKCWGSNAYGQIGNGKTSTTPQTIPVEVSKGGTSAQSTCTSSLWGVCLSYSTTPATPANPMVGKYVEKVSVGSVHTCALAEAKMYCWGNNAWGQLGNRSTTSSSIPVAVDVQSQDITPPPVMQKTGCGGWFQPQCKLQPQPVKPKSALANKEIIDITAGDNFSCALASDGSVACWGANDFGRLGTGDSADYDYPKSVYKAADSALANKKGVKLAKASQSTMCVLAVDANDTSGTAKGTPYCWGFGIGNDTIPANGQVTVACSKDSPTTRPTGTSSETVYFWSARPIQISATQYFTDVDGNDYLTGLSDNNRAYYWGLHGYREDLAYTNTNSCRINPCTSMDNTIRFAVSVGNSAGDKAKAKAKKNAQNGNKPGGDKNKNLSSNQTAQQAAQNAARGGVSSSVSGTGGNLRVGGSLSSTASYSANYARTVQATDAGYNVTVNSYRGVARPSGSATGASQVGGGGSNSCASVTHYGYTANRTVTEVGKMVPTVPTKSVPLSQGNVSVLSGNVQGGLFCATNASGAFCDANGTSVNEGQTGSNYTKHCVTTGFIFTKTTCDPAPTGPQQVVGNGWLAGKSITALNKGFSGYTCALANESVGCWGLNDRGQLGTGDTANRNVPTPVRL